MPSSMSRDRETGDADVMLTVSAENPATELFIVDNDFALADRGIHRLDAKLRPGIYKVKARLGLREWEQLIVVDKNMTLDVPPIEFVSATPLTETACVTTGQQDFAVQASRNVNSRVGTGARIFLMSRVWSGEASANSSRAGILPPFRQVKLRRWRGDVIANLTNHGDVFSDADPAVATCIEVNEGNYLVEFETQDGTNLLPICAREGWQTQVFILHATAYSETDIYSDVSVLMTRGSFEPNDSIVRATDAARLALAQDRVVASGQLLEFARGKVENPTLGIISAHLLLLARKKQQEKEDRARRQETGQKGPELKVEFNQSLFDEIVFNTSGLLGADQPDVVALSLHCTDSTPVRQVRVPPMFWRSWQLLIEASNDNPDLIPESLWRRVDSASNLRPFFSWIETDESQAKSLGAALGTAVEPLVGAVAPAQEFPMRAVRVGLESASSDPLQKPSPDQLKNWAGGMAGGHIPLAEMVAGANAEEEDKLKRRMTAQLNVPRGMLDRTFES